MIDRLRILTLLALSAALPSCIVLPFATPPLAVSAGGGVRYGAPKGPGQGPGLLHLDIGMKPLQLMQEWRNRRADVGMGYTLETGAGRTLHGAFLEGAVFPAVDSVGRIGIHGQPRVWFEEGTGNVGFGMGARVSAEARWFTKKVFSGTSSSGGVVGYAHGEGGIGLYIEGAYAKIGDRPSGTIGLGLSARIPASVGLALAFLR